MTQKRPMTTLLCNDASAILTPKPASSSACLRLLAPSNEVQGGVSMPKTDEKKQSTQRFRKTLYLPGGVRKEVYGKTKQDLDEKVLKLQLQLCAGVDLSKDTTFGAFTQMWFESYKKDTIRQSTQAYYKNVLNNHILPYLGDYQIRDISPMNILCVMNNMRTLSKAVNRKALQILRGIFNAAIDNNLIMKSPVPLTLKAGGKPPVKRESISLEQETILLKALNGTRAYPFVLLALNTGMRRGELLALMWDCVDFDRHVLYVRRNLVFQKTKSELHEYLKTDCSVRDLPMTKQAEQELRRLKEHSNSVFVLPGADGRPMTRQSFRSLWEIIHRRQTDYDGPETYGDIARIIDFPVTSHQLRHTFLTRCFEHGLDVKEVQYLAGHKTPDLTMRIYVHYQVQQRLEETFEKMREIEFA